MKPICLMLAGLLTACAVEVEDSRPRVESGACIAAGDAVAQAWEEILGPLPAKCEGLEMRILVVSQSEINSRCGVDPDRGDLRVGCTFPRTIYLSDAIGPVMQAELAAHEWGHAYAWCAGYSTHDNLEHGAPLLWGDDSGDYHSGGPDTVIGRAQEIQPMGPCL